MHNMYIHVQNNTHPPCTITHQTKHTHTYTKQRQTHTQHRRNMHDRQTCAKHTNIHKTSQWLYTNDTQQTHTHKHMKTYMTNTKQTHTQQHKIHEHPHNIKKNKYKTTIYIHKHMQRLHNNIYNYNTNTQHGTHGNITCSQQHMQHNKKHMNTIHHNKQNIYKHINKQTNIHDTYID